MPVKKIITLIILFFSVLSAQQRYELSDIVFRGNDEISSSTLQSVILSEETPWWFWKFLNSFTPLGSEPVYFDSSYISIDLKSLEQYYNANGFFEARFSSDYKVDTADNTVTLTYTIKEGDPSTYGKINLVNLDSLPADVNKEIRDILDLDTTNRYAQTELSERIDRGLTVMFNTGYMTAEFDSTIIIKDTVANKADIDIYYSLGRRYVIDTVKVVKGGEGASDVSENLLREITDIESGDIYSQEVISRSQTRLFRTGLFSSVSLHGVEEDTSGNRVPLELVGQIGLMNEVVPEVIVNNQQNALNVGLGLSYIRKNFLGDARKLTLSSSFGVQDFYNVDFANLSRKFSIRDTSLLGYVDLRATMEQPYLFNKTIFGTWENYATVNKQKNYNVTTYGSKITFEFELPTYTFINFFSTSYNIEESKELYRLNNDSISAKTLSVIGAELGKTTADDILFPTRGYNISLSLEEANALPYLIRQLADKDFSGALFFKVLFTSSYYLSLDVKKKINICYEVSYWKYPGLQGKLCGYSLK